jgi:hypothetical protein
VKKLYLRCLFVPNTKKYICIFMYVLCVVTGFYRLETLWMLILLLLRKQLHFELNWVAAI